MLRRYFKIVTPLLMACLLLAPVRPLFAEEKEEQYDDYYSTEKVTLLEFSDKKIKENVPGKGYIISGTTLTITDSGRYIVRGSCSEGNVIVNDGLKDVVLIFHDLNLTSSITSPVTIGENSSVIMHTYHTPDTVTLLTRKESDNNITGGYFETETAEGKADKLKTDNSAVIKVNKDSSLTICGEGQLEIYNNSGDGIKGDAGSSLNINSRDCLYVTAYKGTGIDLDGKVSINSGYLEIKADGDGIRAVPDNNDKKSAGDVIINSGNTEIIVKGNGILADHEIIINNGTLDITTLSGYFESRRRFDPETMSCKGICVIGNRTGDEKTLIISGGDIKLNTADNAIHSAEYVRIDGGDLSIASGEVGIHAGKKLVLGDEIHYYDRDPELNISTSRIGLESCGVSIHSGIHYIKSKNYGIKAFNDPEGHSVLYMCGGNVQINLAMGSYPESLNKPDGCGIIAIGDIYFEGGNTRIMGMEAGGSHAPIECAEKIYINNATVFAAGTMGSEYVHDMIDTSQQYIYTEDPQEEGTDIHVNNGNDTVYCVRNNIDTDYVFFTSPTARSSYTFSKYGFNSCSSAHALKDDAFANHKWTSKETKTSEEYRKLLPDSDSKWIVKPEGIITYTCSICKRTEIKTIPALTQCIGCNKHEIYSYNYDPYEEYKNEDTSSEHTSTDDPNKTQSGTDAEKTASSSPVPTIICRLPTPPVPTKNPDSYTSSGNNLSPAQNTKSVNNKTTSRIISLSSVTCTSGTKMITGKISVKGAIVQIKIGKGSYKKAKLTGYKFKLKLPKMLKKKTKITIKVTKKKYKALKKTCIVK